MIDKLPSSKLLENLRTPYFFRDIMYIIVGFGFFWGLLMFGKFKISDVQLEQLPSSLVQIFAFFALTYMAGISLSMIGAFFSKSLRLIWQFIFRKDRLQRLKNLLTYFSERPDELDLTPNTIYYPEIHEHFSNNHDLFQNNERDINHQIFSRTLLGALIIYSVVISYLFILPAILILLEYYVTAINLFDRAREIAQLISYKEKKEKEKLI